MITVSDGCDLGENLAIQAMTNLAERGSLGVREQQSAFQLVFQDAVFAGQIFVTGQQLCCTIPVMSARMRAQSITPLCADRRSPVVAIAPKNLPERLRHSYAGRGQLTALSAALVFDLRR
jgi:hypothetical protein